MAKLIFDKGTEHEREMKIVSFHESPLEARMSAFAQVQAAEGAEYPPLDALVQRPEFGAVTAETDDGGTLPLAAAYRAIQDISVDFNDGGKIYSVSITLRGGAEK